MPTEWATLAVNQRPGSGDDYPFAHPSDDVRFILGDLVLSYQDDNCQFRLPFRVSEMRGFAALASDSQSSSISQSVAGLHERDIVIVDADDNVVFDTATAQEYNDQPWGPHLNTMAWTGETATLQATAHTNDPPWLPPRTIPDVLNPVDGVLDSRTYNRMPRRVLSVRNFLTKFTSGNLALVEGYNISMAVSTAPRIDGGRLVHRVEVRAMPGDGKGRVPGCGPDEAVIRRVNSVGPSPGGNLILNPEACYWLRRPFLLDTANPRTFRPDTADLTAEEAMAALQLLNDCGPCCECDDFVRTYKGLARLWDKYMTLGDRGEAICDLYRSNIDRWNAQAECRKNNPLKLVLIPEQCRYLFVGASSCNLTKCCIKPLVLRVTLQAYRAGEIQTPGTVAAVLRADDTRRSGSDTGCDEIGFVPSGIFPVMDAWFDCSEPNANSMFRTRMCFPDIDENYVVQAALTLHAPDGEDPQTGTVCSSDIIVPPAWLSQLWSDTGNPPPYPTRALLQKTAPLFVGDNC